jgi:hypothetical protein
MARPRLPDAARVPIELMVSAADAAGIDQVLERPEFAGWTRDEWCREIIRTALRYYVGAPGAADAVRGRGPARATAHPDPGRGREPARPASHPEPPAARRERPSSPQAAGPPAPSPGAAPAPSPPPAPAPAEAAAGAEPLTRPECQHPAGARDYETGTCAACGAILWD